MPKREWAETALTSLQQGQRVQIVPRGHSMQGRIRYGQSVTLAPCTATDLAIGDVVLARIQGKRYSLLVLHQIMAYEAGRFLIGNIQGRIDGWLEADDIFGKVIEF